MDSGSKDADTALAWKLTAETVQRAYDRLHDAITTYLTGPSNKTLKALWREVDAPDPALTDGEEDA
jgi:hypothetical protein